MLAHLLTTVSKLLGAGGTKAIPNETRKVLLGHKNSDITTHYSAPELEELFEAANRVRDEEFGKTPALVVIKQKVVSS